MKKKLGKTFAVLLTAVLVCALFSCKSSNAKYPSEPKNARPIVTLGDSLTSGDNVGLGEPSNYAALRPTSYPTLLGAKLRVPVVNISKSGLTAVEAVDAQIGSTSLITSTLSTPLAAGITASTTFIDAVKAYNPQMVIIWLGANDYLYSGGFATTGEYARTVYKDAYQKIITALVTGIPDVKIFLANGYPSKGANIANQMFLMRLYVPTATGALRATAATEIKDMTNAQLSAELFSSYEPWLTVQQKTLTANNAAVKYVGCLYEGAWGDNTGFTEVPPYSTKAQHPTMSDLSHPNEAGYAICAENMFKATYSYLRDNALVKDEFLR